MAATATNTKGGLQLVVTRVHPGGHGMGMEASASHIMVGQKLERFRKGHPKALGTVQIMIGIVMILMGVVMAVNADGVAVVIGMYFWASVIYIASGSLAVAADNKLNRCRVNATLGMSVIAPIAAVIGIIFYSLDTVDMIRYMQYCSRSPSRVCSRFQERSAGISFVMLILSVLEFIVSICMSAFACKAACNSEPQQVFVIGNDMLQNQGSPRLQEVQPDPVYTALYARDRSSDYDTLTNA